MKWDEVKDMAPLYVIGALDERTARDLEASLHSATQQQRRVIAEWRYVAALLPQALPLQTPPDELRVRLLSRIAEETQQTPFETAVEESVLGEMAGQTERKVVEFTQTRREKSRTLSWLSIAAMILFAVTSGRMYKQNADIARERDDLSREVVMWRQQVDDIVSPRTRVIAMIGDEVPEASAKVVWDTKARQWAIYIFDLPAPPSEKDYQIWYVTKDAKVSAAVFRTNEQGRTVLKLSLPPEALVGLAATAVTLEPRGGSSQPTGKLYLKATI